MAPETLIARRIAAFTVTLRDAGFVAGMRETEDAARIMASPLARSPATLRPAFRALFAGDRAGWVSFDAIFDAAFLGKRMRQTVRVVGTVPAAAGPRSLRQLAAERREAGRGDIADTVSAAETEGAGADGAGMQGGASATEASSERDLRQIADADQLAAAEAVAGRLVAVLHARHARRGKRARHGGRLDLRRTIRASLGHGGTPFELAWKRPRPRPLRIALLLDVSGSMTPHTALFLRFALGLARTATKAEIFLLHTRLIAVADAMRDRDRPRALDRLTLLSKGIGGGTLLGEGLRHFNRHHAPRALAGRSVCFIVSDGYETREPALLGREMAALQRRSRRIVWLNPAIERETQAPVAQGMRAAMPHIRLLVPANSLDSLTAMEKPLSRL